MMCFSLEDAIDSVVIESLKKDYKLNCKPEKIDCSDDYIDPDVELLRSIEVVLKYYLTSTEYEEWRNKYVYRQV